ncbi:DUF4401 domain-containing protein [Shewanella dokdonensis]|uniref:DUF4401 domain-containing protein n=1 Tax=Shewanella dokdonensis TaxID=712036 RepID=UPI00200D1961|nr:DUF4401 domain-containing protein [Shewanella dokdonensis]MCL1075057.1 DUF4401 domain-containing protein [Shewanella dokdonensis]
MSRQRLWQQLVARQLLQGEMPVAPPIPWYVVLLQTLAAWIASGFMLGFLGSLMLVLPVRESDGFAIGGALSFVIAIFIVTQQQRRYSGLFLSQLGFCFAMAAIGGIAIGLVERLHLRSDDIYLLLIVSGLLHWRIFALFSIRFCAALLMLGAAILWLLEHGLGVLISPVLLLASFWLWRYEADFGSWRPLLRPLAFAAALLLPWVQLPLLEHASVAFHQSQWALSAHWPALLNLFCVLILLPVTWIRQLPMLRQRLGLAALLLLFGGWLYWIPGLVVGLALCVLGFAAAEGGLLVMGVLSVLGFSSWFYYSLSYTLLVKSVLLLGLGISLLWLLWFIKTQWFTPQPWQAPAPQEAD